MQRITSLVGMLALVLIGSLAVRANQSTTQPSEEKQAKAIKLTQPWNKLTTLTDEQKAQIHAIHQTANAEIKAIKDKEDADIMALLTDEQKAELKQLEEQHKAEQKAKRAEKRAEEAESANDD